MNSEFSQRQGNIARGKLQNKNNTAEFDGTKQQEIGIPTLDSFGIKSSDSNDSWDFETTSKVI